MQLAAIIFLLMAERAADEAGSDDRGLRQIVCQMT